MDEKNSSDSQIGLGLRPRPILAVLGIFFTQLFPNWTACSPITYTNFISSCFSMLMPIDKRAIKGKTLKKRLLFAYREDKTSLSSLTLHSSQLWHSRQAFAPPFLHEISTQHARKYHPGKADSFQN